MDAKEEMRTLLGIGRVVRAGGVDVTVNAFVFSQLFDVISAAWPIVDLLVDQKAGIMEAMTANKAAIARLVEISTGLPIERINALPISDGLRLATAVYAENQVFFLEELTPMLVSALAPRTAKSSSSDPTPPVPAPIEPETKPAGS